MPGSDRRLWIGPFGAALRDRALERSASESGPDPASDLWLVPTDLAREQIVRSLTLGRKQPGPGPKVWCWDDLWRAVGSARDDAPARLGPAAERAALNEAIDRARRSGRLRTVRGLADTPGFRRRLRQRFAGWTRAERPLGSDPPDSSPAGRDEWAIFGQYRAILNELRAEDAEGFAAWASRILRRDPPAALRQPGHVTVLEPTGAGRAARRALEFFKDHARGVLVTLPHDAEPALAEPYEPVARLRERLLGWGFAETAFEPDLDRRPAGLLGVERELFRADAHRRDGLADADGLGLLGAPQGEGVGLVVAHRVKQLLDQGAGPDDILVLFRRWDEQADLVGEALRAWGVPAWWAPRRALAADSAVATLLLAIGLPGHGWEASRLIRLLRNSQFRPAWPELVHPHAAAATATALREARVFRGREAMRRALDRISQSPDPKSKRRERPSPFTRVGRAQMALPVLDRFLGLFDDLGGAAPWQVQVDRLADLIRALRLDSDALGHLLNALDDHGAALDGLGLANEPTSWPAFAEEVEQLARELPASGSSPVPGSVRLLTVDEAAGARARHLVLANLVEGSFPVREAVDPELADALDDRDDDSDETPAGRPNLAFAREMLRFLRVVGSADATLDLVYPTGDEKGQELLPAGFLLDVRRLLPAGAADLVREVKRLDPAAYPADLAGCPRDARVRAVALALDERPETSELVRLAADPAHRAALLGTAAALWVVHFRVHRREQFGPFDGRLRDGQAIAQIADMFKEFSPSQLESLVTCPFQFYARYVLGLDPLDERDELEDDRAWRGSLLHKVLERLHSGLQAESVGGTPVPVEEVAARIQATIQQVLDEEPEPVSDVEQGLLEIERVRLEQTGELYAKQYGRYVAAPDGTLECRGVEVAFGSQTGGDGQANPSLVLGSGDDTIRLRGKIDRIDLLRPSAPGQARFRVIDYKTGSCPKARDVTSGLALQLPLYALAVERVGLAGQGIEAEGFGYWALRDKGFAQIKAGDWRAFRERLEAFVLAVVGQLRVGAFPVSPRPHDCTKACDYHAICRIGQVRSAPKAWDDAPTMDGSP